MKGSLPALRLTAGMAAAAFGVWISSAHAWEQYSEDTDATNCARTDCHGDFRDDNYISATDGMNWGDLHDLHRNGMLNGDCATCHGSSGFSPVMLAASEGGDGLDAISCAGCHGRTEDDTAANPDFGALSGYAAGLRQHHHGAGVTICADCHDDADPANYTPVGEGTLPPYYADPGMDHPDMPANACDGSEDFAGAPEGLDNDGDGSYELEDSDCATPIEPATWGEIKALYGILLR